MSNVNKETIADIINEKRTTAREIRSKTPNQYGLELAVMLEAEADRIEAALSEPLRNCDVYTAGEALRKYGFPTKIKPWGEKEWLDFCEWLVSEVEGETNGESYEQRD